MSCLIVRAATYSKGTPKFDYFHVWLLHLTKYGYFVSGYYTTV